MGKGLCPQHQPGRNALTEILNCKLGLKLYLGTRGYRVCLRSIYRCAALRLGPRKPYRPPIRSFYRCAFMFLDRSARRSTLTDHNGPNGRMGFLNYSFRIFPIDSRQNEQPMKS